VQPRRAADQQVTASGFTATFPAQSITLFVLSPCTPAPVNSVLPALLLQLLLD
jgi:hypothetical protein